MSRRVSWPAVRRRAMYSSTAQFVLTDFISVRVSRRSTLVATTLPTRDMVLCRRNDESC